MYSKPLTQTKIFSYTVFLFKIVKCTTHWGAKCTNYFSLFPFSIIQYSIYLTVCTSFAFLPFCSLLCLLALVPFPSIPLSCLCTNTVPTFYLSPAPSFFLRQIFKHSLVCTSLTPMPHYRPMARTVGFAPTPCVILTFLTPTSAHILHCFLSAQFSIVVWLFCTMPSFWVDICAVLLVDVTFCHCAVRSSVPFFCSFINFCFQWQCCGCVM